MYLPLGHHEVLGRVHEEHLEGFEHLAGERIDPAYTLHLVECKLDAEGLLHVRRKYLEDISLETKLPALQNGVVSLVLQRDKLHLHLLEVHLHAGVEAQTHVSIVLWTPEPVDAGDGRDDNHIVSLEKVGGRRQAQPVDLVIDGGVLLDVEIPRGDVGLGLVVVVIGDEVLHRVLGKELRELPIELRGERLVVRHHERRHLGVGYQVRHGKGFARTGNALEGLETAALVEAG